MSDDIVESAVESAENSPPDSEESSGFSRRSFLKAAALGTAAAALMNRGGLELGPASALAGAAGCVDLSGNPCTANDVNITCAVEITNPCSCTSGTFTAQVKTCVQNNTSTGRYCVQLNLPPGSLGTSQTNVVCVILSNATGGGSTANPGPNTMTGSIPNFPCSAGLITVNNATIGWSTASGSATCTIPTFVPGGQCHRQTIQFVNFQASLSCGNGTQNCTAPCTGLATLTACVIADSTETPVSLTLTNNASLPTLTATITAGQLTNFSACHDFSPATLTQNTTFTLSATDAQGCTRTAQKTVAFSRLAQPSLTVSQQTCASGSTVFTASPSGLSDYTFTVDGTNYDNGTNAVLTLSTLASGSHSAKVTVANSLACTAASPSSAFNTPTAVTASLSASTASCAGNNVILTATASGGTPSYSYAFSEGTTPLATNNSGTFTVVAPTSGAHTYTVSVSDSGGCSTTANASTTVPTPVAVQSFTASTASCAGNSITLTAVGTGGTAPYTYAFSEGTTPLATNSSGTFTVVAPTSGLHTYTVSITDANQCDNATKDASTTVPQPVTTSIDLGSNTNCAGSITFTATGHGGTGSYTFAWTVDQSAVANNSTNMLTYTPSSAASFGTPHTIAVTATDSNGCVSTNTPSRTLTECVSFTVT
jgi:hypothetical protein